jgi:hypothetical protein
VIVDTLLPILTVEEMLMYTAELKRPRSIPLAEKHQAVEELLDKLALQDCRWAPLRKTGPPSGPVSRQAAVVCAANKLIVKLAKLLGVVVPAPYTAYTACKFLYALHRHNMLVIKSYQTALQV